MVMTSSGEVRGSTGRSPPQGRSGPPAPEEAAGRSPSSSLTQQLLLERLVALPQDARAHAALASSATERAAVAGQLCVLLRGDAGSSGPGRGCASPALAELGVWAVAVVAGGGGGGGGAPIPPQEAAKAPGRPVGWPALGMGAWLARAGALGLVLRAMQTHVECGGVQRGGCWAIAALAPHVAVIYGGDRTATTAAADSGIGVGGGSGGGADGEEEWACSSVRGACAAVQVCMGLHAADPAVQVAGCAALEALLGLGLDGDSGSGGAVMDEDEDDEDEDEEDVGGAMAASAPSRARRRRQLAAMRGVLGERLVPAMHACISSLRWHGLGHGMTEEEEGGGEGTTRTEEEVVAAALWALVQPLRSAALAQLAGLVSLSRPPSSPLARPVLKYP
jgi:hypothetical protein